MKKNYLLTIVFICMPFLLISSCKQITHSIHKIQPELITLPQEHSQYYSRIKNNQSPYMANEIQLLSNNEYKKKFLSPWAKTNPQTSKESLIKTFQRFKTTQRFGENKQPILSNRIEALEKTASLENYPNMLKYGITLTHTNLRILPTKKPFFTNFRHDGEGFPFDILQNSLIPANTPILITHLSKNKDWSHIETPIASGWVPIRDIAFAGPKFLENFTKLSTFIAPVKDNTPIYTTQGNYVYNGHIGMMFPKIRTTKNDYYIAIAEANKSRLAYIKECKIPKNTSTVKPLPLTIENVGKISDELINKPYGWGGSFENRDCSAMLRDLFGTFGIWLPRNSRAQAFHGGRYIHFKDLSNNQKEAMIIQNATPYMTLLWLPGHIMLYIGEENGKVLVFHNIWGLRTTTASKRQIIGKSIISTLEPGKENPDIDPELSLIERLEGMTLIGAF